MNKNNTGFAYAFYVSREWRTCKEAYLQKVGRICERCAKKGYIVQAEQVHHKIKLTPENIKDPRISLNPENLEALCTDCHQAEHAGRRWKADKTGHIEL